MIELQMAAGVDRSSTPTGEQYRQIVVIVGVAVRNTAAVNNHAVIEQGSFTFLDGLQFIKEIREFGRVQPVDLGRFVFALLRSYDAKSCDALP